MSDKPFPSPTLVAWFLILLTPNSLYSNGLSLFLSLSHTHANTHCMHTYKQTHTHAYMHARTHTHRQTDRPTDRQTDKQTDIQTDRHTHTHTHTHTNTHTQTHTCMYMITSSHFVQVHLTIIILSNNKINDTLNMSSVLSESVSLSKWLSFSFEPQTPSTSV